MDNNHESGTQAPNYYEYEDHYDDMHGDAAGAVVTPVVLNGPSLSASRKHEGFGAPKPDKPKRDKPKRGRKASGASDCIAEATAALTRLNSIISEICSTVESAEMRRSTARFALKKAGISLPVAEINSLVKDKELDLLLQGKVPGFIGSSSEPVYIHPSTWLVDSLIKEGEFNMLAGATGSGKTTLLIEILQHLREGRDSFLNSKVADFSDRHIIYVGVDNRMDFFVHKFVERGIGSLDLPGSDGVCPYFPDPKFSFDSDYGHFKFNGPGLAKFEETYLIQDGKPLEKPLVIIDSASTVFSKQGVKELDDLIIGMLCDFSVMLNKYQGTSVCMFHMPKANTMLTAGARAVRGHGGPAQVAGQVITLGLIDDVDSNEFQIQSMPYRRLYAAHRSEGIDWLVKLGFNGEPSEFIGNFNELRQSGELQRLVNAWRGNKPTGSSGPNSSKDLSYVSGQLSGNAKRIFDFLAGVDLPVNGQQNWDATPTTPEEAVTWGYRSADQIIRALDIPKGSAYKSLKTLTNPRKQCQDAALVDDIVLTTDGKKTKFYRAYQVSQYHDGDY